MHQRRVPESHPDENAPCCPMSPASKGFPALRVRVQAQAQGLQQEGEPAWEEDDHTDCT